MYLLSAPAIRRCCVNKLNRHNVRNVNYVSEVYDKSKLKINSITSSERFKGTIVEKWVLYWKDLYRDYYDVARESVSNIKDSPKKSFVYFLFCGFLLYCNKENPTEACFRDTLLSASNSILLVSKEIRNPASDEHLKFIESCYNAGLVRRFSFGIFSVMWLDDYDKDVGLYKAQCTYLKPYYGTIYKRVIDVGFLNKWWLVENKMVDYDVNPSEWCDNSQVKLA